MRKEKYSLEIEDHSWIKDKPCYTWRLVTYWASIDSYREYARVSDARRSARHYAARHNIEIDHER